MGGGEYIFKKKLTIGTFTPDLESYHLHKYIPKLDRQIIFKNFYHVNIVTKYKEVIGKNSSL